ncbi:hypothetical protein NPX13_g9216 [Xylaria arbuscula]|uniref:Clr5 domain-containing protein n=1 Tax=Xylaria arbuscula TaxID=114810 RepID=A0A9W8N753_9PEZI|nr:hypothetical protein NPX13_g9216 [Xylaria arbuscula]
MEDTWEYHKDTIRQLYLVTKLPVSMVALQLKEKHKFDRRVHQYHHKLKQWGFRKNLTQAEREKLYQSLNKRKADDSEVLLSGVKLGGKRLKRLMSRVSVSSEWTRPQLIVSILPSAKPQLPRLSWFGRLPWFEFSKIHLSVALPDNTSSISTTMVWGRSDPVTNTLTQVTSLSTTDIQSLIPEEYSGDHAKVVSNIKRGNAVDIEREAFKILLYKLSNKMLINHDVDNGLSDATVLKMIGSIVDKNPEWMNSVLDSRSLTAKAIAEHVFAAAVRQVDFSMACRLLETGLICPNGKILASPQHPIYKFKRGNSVIQLTFASETFICTPLQMAASTGNNALIKALLRAGADVNLAEDCTDLSALELACSLRSSPLALSLVEILLRHGAAVNRPSLTRRPTALMIAVASGNAALVTFLKRHGADIERIYVPDNSNGLELTALRISFLRWNLEVFEAITWGVGFEDPELMVLAISARNHNVLRHLRHRHIKLCAESSWGEHALVAAIFMEETTFKLPTARRYRQRNNRPGPMHAAAFVGHPNLIGLLHERGFSITPIISCDSQEDRRKINAIYSTYAEEPFSEWELLRTPLQVALYRKNVATALRILDLGGKVFCGNEISLAARIGSPSLIHALVKYGAPVNEAGTTPVQTALQHQNLAAADALLALGTSIVDGDLTRAIMSGDSSLIDLVWQLATSKQRQSLGPDSITPLEASCATGNRKLFRLILSQSWAGYDSAALCASVWYAIARHGKAFDFEEHVRHIIEPLLRMRKRGKYMDTLEATALAIAIKYRYEYEGALYTLLSYLRPSAVLALDFSNRNVGPNFWWRNTVLPHGKSPLHTAVHEQTLQVVTRLLNAGFKPDEECLLETLELSCGTKYASAISTAIWQEKHPCTWSESLVARAFEKALEFRRKSSVEKLLELKLQVNTRRNQDSGWTPLQLAASYSDNAMVQRLIGVGADVNAHAAPLAGATALQIAAISNKMDIVRTLLEHDADINALGARIHGRTALEGAAEYGRQDMVQLLLNKGAKTDGEYRAQYLRAIRFAENSGHLAVVELLREHRRWTAEDAELMSSEDLMNED